jgi:hypothetical protein
VGALPADAGAEDRDVHDLSGRRPLGGDQLPALLPRAMPQPLVLPQQDLSPVPTQDGP